jgi:hypothetical protein
MRKIILVIALLILPNIVYAEKGDIPCVNGTCEGWHAWYEKNAFKNDVIFHFDNNTGVTAFNITVIVNMYDYFDNYLGRIEKKVAGPIHKFINLGGTVHKDTSKMTCDIYWSETYTGTGDYSQ